MRKDFKTTEGAKFYHSPINSYWTSGHVKWYPGKWYDPKSTRYDISAKLLGEGSVEDYQYLVGTTHFDDNDGCCMLLKKIMSGGLQSARLL